jgi:hypothetical protein
VRFEELPVASANGAQYEWPIVPKDVASHRAGAKQRQPSLRHHVQLESPAPVCSRPLRQYLIALEAHLQRLERIIVVVAPD